MSVRTERVHAAETIQEDLAEALRITDALEPSEDLRLAVFNCAAQLLTQRAIVQPTAAVGLPAMAIPRGRTH